MGFFNQLFNLPDPPKSGNDGGNGNVHDHKKRPSKEVEKQNKRKWYEDQEKEMTKEERDRANKPPDEPRDGKIV